MDGGGESKTYNVVHGRMVLEGTPDFLGRRAAIAARFTPSTCRKCGGEDYAHGLVGKVMCPNWRPFGPPSIAEKLEREVARIVGRRPENIEALMNLLREALS